MRRYLVIIIVVFLLLPLFAKKVGGVNLPNSLTIERENLILNGAGLRKKVIIKVYACGLYLPKPSDNASEILNANTAVNIRMHFIYKEVNQEKLIEAWNEGFANAGYTTEFAKEIAIFNALFREPAQKGDIYDISYIPGSGIKVIKNDIVLGTIDNPGFRKSVFSIWLGENTALPKLKESLLED